MSVKFVDLIDIGILQELLNSFAPLYPVATAVLDVDGTILAASNWRRICTAYHRVNPTTAQRCLESDTELANGLKEQKEYNVYRCKNGLVDVAVPIIIENEHLANFFVGQFFFERPDRTFFIDQAHKMHFNTDDYLKALDEVQVISEVEIKNLLNFLTHQVKVLALLGKANLDSKRSNEELEKRVEERTRDLVKAKESVEESEIKFFTIFNESFDSIVILDPRERKIVDVNATACSTYGYSKEEMLNLYIEDIDIIDDTAGVQKRSEVLIERGWDKFITKHITKDKRVLDVFVSAKSIILNEKPYLYSIFHDITKQKVNEEKLQKAQKVANLGIWDFDLIEQKLNWSDEIFNIFELDKDTFTPSYDAFLDIIHPDDKEAVANSYTQSLETKKPYHITHRLLMKDGRVKWVEEQCDTDFDKEGNPLKSIGTVYDITKLKETEAELKNILKQQESLYKVQTTGFVTLKDRHLTWTNEVFENMLGYEKGELQGKPVRIMYADEQEYQSYGKDAYKALSETGVFTRAVNCVKKDKTPITLMSSITSLNEDNTEAVGIAFDITELRKQQEELKEAKAIAERANQAKSEFLANMSHEIRTPLNGIIGLTNLTLDTQLTPLQRDYLFKAQQSSHALLNVINDILDYSKIEAGKLEIVNQKFELDALLGNISNLFGYQIDSKGLDFIFKIDPKVPNILIGDSLRITQVLNNLVGNSVKFTSSGFIIIEINLMAQNDLKVSLEFRVQDSGIGISSQVQQKLFKPFEQGDTSTTKEFGGTGLGLMICKQIVSLMGGTITLQSQEGVGTTFIFDLELEYDKESNLEESSKTKCKQKKHFLVVNDQDIERDYLTHILNSWNIDVTQSRDALDAYRLLQEKSYDTVLLDWMTSNVDGVSLLIKLNEANINTSNIVMLPANKKKTLLEQIEQYGLHVENIIEKPYTASVVFNTVFNTIEKAADSIDSEKHLKLKEKKHALLVEDNLINQLVAKSMLEQIGFEVEVANNGKIAVDKAKEGSFDIIFMDIQMPVMDGYEASLKIRTFNENIPIIALSAAVMPHDKELSKSAKMDVHLSKPIKKDELDALIKSYFSTYYLEDVVEAIDKKRSSQLKSSLEEFIDDFENYRFVSQQQFDTFMQFLKTYISDEESIRLNSLFDAKENDELVQMLLSLKKRLNYE